ncbi:MAG: aldo/keto reductase [Mycobacterium sp.]|nr:aldo/keto reductase [Mycobacterium sp.]MCW2746771.1 aldo/keto reductase [Mycobacterium sp.]
MTDVTYRPLGNSGLVVSTIGLGCNNFGMKLDHAGTKAVVDAALDAGITLFDTADVYGGQAGHGASETLLGQALGSRRDEIVLATKFGMDMQGANGPDWGARGSRRYIRRAVEASLRRLQTDHIDLYQYHRPDGVTPLEETLAALHELVVEGKVVAIGSSNFAGWQIADAAWIASTSHSTPFISAQNHYSLLERGIEAEVRPSAVAHGVGILPFFPLANGLLTGKYRKGHPVPAGTRLAGGRFSAWLTDDRLESVERIAAYAEERGISILDVGIGGLAAQPGVASVIAGATKPEQVTANVAAAAWHPTADDLAALDAILPPAPAQQ